MVGDVGVRSTHALDGGFFVGRGGASDEEHVILQVTVPLSSVHKGLLAKVEELEEALAHVVALQGLLSICMHCKKIKNDKGSWDQMEKYISKHSDAKFSHCICPDCKEEHYPTPAPPSR